MLARGMHSSVLVARTCGRLILLRRKSRCSGTIPCKRCNELSISCRYEFPHRRGQPASPPNETSSIAPDPGPNLPQSQLPQQQLSNVPDQVLVDLSSELVQSDVPREAIYSSRTSPGRDAAVFEGQYIGPTSGLAFLHRAEGRLRQDFSSRNGVGTPRPSSSIFSFGDKPFTNSSCSSLVLPSRQQAREHVKRYFEFAIPTYRFLHQETVERWLDKYMDEIETVGNKGEALTDGKAAVVLMVLATSALYRVDDAATIHDAEAEDYDQR
jgi:hypothetical protein